MAVNSTFDAANHYFSGQGVVMIGSRDVNGNPTGLRPLGNVADLKIEVATTVIDHKGSQDGQRAIDVRLQTETKATASITIENWIAANLAKALRGDSVTIPAGTVTAEVVSGYPGLVTGLQHINISSLVLTKGATPLTAYVDAVTPYDYKVNLNAGSFELNDGSGVASVNLAASITAITVGSSTLLTVTNTAAVGDTVTINGLTGADAGLLNGQTFVISAATGTAVTVPVNTTGKTITATGTPTAYFPNTAISISAAYSYSAQYHVNGLTQPLTDAFLRFEGLNTVEGNTPVIVELFKFSADPLKELALISDTFGQFMLEGALLSDPLRTSGSKYFSVKKLN